MCTTYVWCLHNTLSDQSGNTMSITGGLQEKRLWGVVAEQKGKGQQSSSTQELHKSNLSLKNQGMHMACLACLKELLTLSDMAQRYLPTCASVYPKCRVRLSGVTSQGSEHDDT